MTKPKKPRGKGFTKNNPQRFKKGFDERRNTGGRPRLIADAYKNELAKIDSKTKFSFAELVANAQIQKAITGDTAAAREIRLATEGQDINFNRLSDAEILEYLAQQTADHGGGQAPRPSDSEDSS